MGEPVYLVVYATMILFFSYFWVATQFNPIQIADDLKKKEKLELKANEAQGKTRRAGCETGKKKLKKELDSIGAALDGVLKKREAIRSEIKAKFLKKFDALKNLKNGRAVVPVWKEVCYGCHMNIPPQMYNELQRNESLMSCPHCERMIYWESRDDDV